MKQLVLLLLCFLCALSSLASCQSNENVDDTGESSTQDTVSAETTVGAVITTEGKENEAPNRPSEPPADPGEAYYFDLSGETSYTLVYSEAECNSAAATHFASLLSDLIFVPITAAPDTEIHEHEILYGNVDRKAAKALADQLQSAGEYAVGVTPEGIVLAGREKIDTVYALLAFSAMLEAFPNGAFYESDSYIAGQDQVNRYPVNVPTATAAYREAYGTYHSYVDRDTDALSEDQKRQILLNQALVELLGSGFVVTTGSSSALYEGFVVKLDSVDYSKKTHLANGDLLIATEFAKNYFGEAILASEDGFCNLSKFLEGSTTHRLLFHEKQGIYLILPVKNTVFDDPEKTVRGFTVRELLDRMQILLNNPIRPEPKYNNTEQTRVVIDGVDFDPDLIYDFTVQGHETLYSPGICSVWENGQEILYVSYEKCTATMMDINKEAGTVTYLRRSTDGGETWETLGEVPEMKWATIFSYQDDIYLLGTNISAGSKLHIAKYDPGNRTFAEKCMEIVGGGGAPCAVVEAKGRIWRASTHVHSAPIGADLFDESSWVVTGRADAVFTKQDFLSAMGLASVNKYSLGEGNIVVKPDGNVYAVFPLNAAPTNGYAVVLRVSEDGRSLSQLSDGKSLMAFPSTNCKASIRFDEKTGLYVALTTLSSTGAQTWYESSRRNVLGIAVSRDMESWRVLDVLLVDREIMSEELSKLSHAYQYADFAFSGDDLRIVIREASGVTSTYHDGKFITLYTLKNYAAWIEERIY